MMIDLNKLKRDLRTAALDCKELKRVLRRRWTEPMADVQRALLRARRRATELNILRAHLRGRYHVTRPPRDGSVIGVSYDPEAHHSQIARRVASDYAVAKSVVTLEAG